MLSREFVEFWSKDCPDLNFENLTFVTTRFFEYLYFGKTTKVDGPFLSAGIFNILKILRTEKVKMCHLRSLCALPLLK